MNKTASLKRPASAIVVGGLLLAMGAAGWPAQAHHSFAMFDRSKKVVLKGTVKEFQWTNPHVFVEMVVRGQGGVSETWAIEAASPNMLFRQGWTFNTFKVGDQVSVTVNPLRDGTHGGTFISAVLSDGKELGFGPAPVGGTRPAGGEG